LTITFRGNSASAMAANGLAVGTIGTGFFAAARTTLTRSRVVANRAQGGTATGGLHQISGNGIYVLERTEVARNTPGDCNFGCQP
jgi:hypothetical protein